MKVLITGAGGFIGHHLVKRLKESGLYVRGVDLKYPEFEITSADDFQILDLRVPENCVKALEGMDQVYHLAADMGGIGYITAHLYSIFRNNALINLNMMEACRTLKVGRVLFTSSACVYPQEKQVLADVSPLKEEDAYPADAEPGYGWEKLFAELGYGYLRDEEKLSVRLVRLHNVYGPLGTFQGGKEKAPAAICRKVALAKDEDEIEIWGDGLQTRSFLYIDDCVRGLILAMEKPFDQPLNLGSDSLVSIEELVNLVCGLSHKTLKKKYNLDAPQGVRGRNCDLSLAREKLGWEPHIGLDLGLSITYRWIEGMATSR